MKLFGVELKFNNKDVALQEQLPTKMSQLENDIGAGGGTTIVISGTQSTGNIVGRVWIKII